MTTTRTTEFAALPAGAFAADDWNIDNDGSCSRRVRWFSASIEHCEVNVEALQQADGRLVEFGIDAYAPCGVDLSPSAARQFADALARAAEVADGAGIACRVHGALLAAGMTFEQLAETIGVDLAELHRMFTTAEVDVLILRRIRKALGLTWGELLGEGTEKVEELAPRGI